MAALDQIQSILNADGSLRIRVLDVSGSQVVAYVDLSQSDWTTFVANTNSQIAAQSSVPTTQAPTPSGPNDTSSSQDPTTSAG